MGKITKLLIDKWSENVGLDIVQQIKSWGKSGDSIDSSGTSPYSFK